MIIILDYGMGNLHSVLKAFNRLNISAKISSDPKDLEKADKIVLPGVGHFKKGMDNLKEFGLIEPLKKAVIEKKTPILGICLGMQLLTNYSQEGNVKGLGFVDAETISFKKDQKLKIPHMGWNTLSVKKENEIISNGEGPFYFVHSFYVMCNDQKDIISKTEYGEEFVSSFQKENIFATQFHPEKSHSKGLSILKKFGEMKNV